MDRLPRLRRKPKPPAIETSVDRTSSDTGESNLATEPASQPSPQKAAMKNSPLRSLKWRVNAKRARTHSPAPRPSVSPVVAVFSQDGVATRSTMVDGSSAKNRPRPVMPAFLNTSTHGIQVKFQELTWADRNRALQAARPDSAANSRWGFFKQTDGPQRGIMDRYFNIKPFNYNRVKLQVPEHEFDYVNASTVVLEPPGDDSQPPLRYIAMQGPTLPSLNYVWRMVAEQTASPAVIIQLTSMVEGGAVKCHQYFPDTKDNATWNLNEDNVWKDDWRARLTFHSLEELANGAIEKRKLLLHVQGEAEPRTVWHLLYTRWPDFGVPTVDDMDNFFELMAISRHHTEPSNPRIIHCSAGVGRTGTFISLEHLMRALDGGKLEATEANYKSMPDVIYDTVENLRQQRCSMVQSEMQYRFLYEATRKLWQVKYGVGALDGHDADHTGNSEPAAKRLEVAGLSSARDGSDSA
ncbi:protein-tyrosine phosphatase 2 [Metarhizium album ARSEF 1941]|uniref:Protein-tyrosine phosphatase 2 n=1 Tax=Metarhizium album (strain ARSEF 1941) TaxID=1081103 RepID=A0A0B2X6A5_METAS|nr:protein-tyrosine phosphatase 2 [Metarhizium album ARSEF 1941]KHO01010.1 protein-tyrosine phosphatase 2 [Metarhizium album ARSEF 1941]